MATKHVLVLTSDSVGPRLAGQAMRMWEISRVLAQHCEVVLMAAHVSPVDPPGFRLVAYSADQFSELTEWADVILATEGTFRVYPRVARAACPLIIDLACPSLIESLELTRQWESPDPWQQTLRREMEQPDRLSPLQRGDFFVCGTPRQRDFYLGMLAALGRLNPLTYPGDLSFQRLIDVVSFGLPASPPQHTRNVLRGVMPGIDHDDFLMIWAGGVWVWFDPWTLLDAMARLRDTLPRVKLFFMGVTPPHPHLHWFSFNDRLFNRARELDVLGKNVFIGREWVDYQDRSNYLLEADIGVTTQGDHLETHFAVRTRVFDYLWAGLPLLSTAGDYMAEIAERRGLGLTVSPSDVDALVGAIQKLASDETLRRGMQERVRELAVGWTWDRVCQPVVEFCLHPRFAEDYAFRQRYVGKPRWWQKAHYQLGVLRRSGFGEFVRSFESLLPLRRIRVAFRDKGFRTGFRAIWEELRSIN